MVIVMTMVINNKWLLCLRIHTHTHTHTHTRSHTHLDQTLLSLLELWIYKIAHYCTMLVCLYVCLTVK